MEHIQRKIHQKVPSEINLPQRNRLLWNWKLENVRDILFYYLSKRSLQSHLGTKTPGAGPVPGIEPTDLNFKDSDTATYRKEEIDGETRPEMDIPTGLDGADFAAGVSQSSSPKKDENNTSGASSDLADYVAPLRQQTCGLQVCTRCGSLIVHITEYHPSYVYPCRTCSFLVGELDALIPKHCDTKAFTCMQCKKGYFTKKVFFTSHPFCWNITCSNGKGVMITPRKLFCWNIACSNGKGIMIAWIKPISFFRHYPQ